MKKVDCQVIGQIAEMLLDGEPVFLLRAQDVAAVPTLDHYLHESKKVDGQNQLRAHAQLQRFKAWQLQHKERVRAAD
jgi:hypothetical protein